jgi:hypothetical protein
MKHARIERTIPHQPRRRDVPPVRALPTPDETSPLQTLDAFASGSATMQPCGHEDSKPYTAASID